MSDPRFARLKNDPRFRPIRKRDSKVVVDDRFKSLIDQPGKKKRTNKPAGRVDKYGRSLSDTHEQDNLRRFYRLDKADEVEEEASPKLVDYARGQVLLESSDEDEDGAHPEQDDSDDDGVVTLGLDSSKPIPVPNEEFEINLDEDEIAELDAQAAAYAKEHPEANNAPDVERTRRIAVVNLDWDHVRAIHLYKIFASLVSPAQPIASSSRTDKSPIWGKVLSVRVYPSQFGKERMAKEDIEGPPAELFKNQTQDAEDINERTVYEVGDEHDYNEDALRKYQLDRLRYYYAVVECDTVDAASYIYSELEGTEFERSANVFDLSFVPDGMSFDDEPRDEATDDLNVPYKPLEFVTDALRHSKVKLTWDDDDAERAQVTRRVLTKNEIEENDFRAYIASASESESEDVASTSKAKMSRDKLRALLLSGGDDALPEGWGKGHDGGGEDGRDVDMEITFTPGLSGAKAEDETTLATYQRKMKEKRKKRKEEKKKDKEEPESNDAAKDDFFGGASDEDESGDEAPPSRKPSKESRGKNKRKGEDRRSPVLPATAEELELVVAPEDPEKDVRHFDMKAVIKAEKSKGKKKRGKKAKGAEEENDLQEDFVINVNDDRFKAIHEDHTYAIDPSNPQFKKTKGMSALLQERSKRLHSQSSMDKSKARSPTEPSGDKQDGLKKLIDSVKRKTQETGHRAGKRRRVEDQS